MFVERGDELIDRYCTAIQNVERTAAQAVKDQREATARQRDERSELAGLLSQILLDAIDNGDDRSRALERRSASSGFAPASRTRKRSPPRSTPSVATRSIAATRTWPGSPQPCSLPSICA
ncbi:MAG TPA: hypothetical protein VED41_04305, partial [Solirubrobacteraceae bacterium]|nr:hypothetical protein [Solirubrobacteraceae bacterium]